MTSPSQTTKATSASSGQKRRSRNGCTLCLAAKVKCSELGPVCERCSRLHRRCEWPGVRLPLREVRRGYGPLKSRQQFVPRAILPSTSTDSIHCTAPVSPDLASSPLTVIGGNPHLQASSQMDTISVVNPVVIPNSTPSDNQWVNVEDRHFFNNPPEDLLGLASYPSFELPPLTTVLLPNMPCVSSLVLGDLEREAMHHYQNGFALSYSKKTPCWSTFAMILHWGAEDPTITHLILAVSLANMFRYSSKKNHWLFGKTHFLHGSKLLIACMNDTVVDHGTTMAAFFLLQIIYQTICGEKGLHGLQQLTLAVTNYVQTHSLLEDIFAERPDNIVDIAIFSPNPKKDGLLAKLMILFLYSDIEAEFYYAGGDFASLLCARRVIVNRIYQISKPSLEIYFGEIYPAIELLDDIEKFAVLDLHFEAAILLHRINIALKQNNITQFDAIEEDFENLERTYASLFQMVESNVDVRSPMLDLADSVLSHFHAVHIYNLRCFPARSQGSRTADKRRLLVTSLLRCAQRTSQERSVVVSARLQWALFIAGIETDDTIYMDWISSKLGDCHLGRALPSISHAQRGGKLGMEGVRSLCSRPWRFHT